VPGHFETPRVYTTVRPPTTITGRGLLDSGRFTYDEFLNVEFDTKLRLADELIIVGRQNTSGDQWSYGLSEIAAPDVTTSEGMVHELSDGVYVTSVEFDEPFAYSTSSWVRGNDYIYFDHHSLWLPYPPLDNIRVMVIVWRLRRDIIRTAPCWVV